MPSWLGESSSIAPINLSLCREPSGSKRYPALRPKSCPSAIKVLRDGWQTPSCLFAGAISRERRRRPVKHRRVPPRPPIVERKPSKRGAVPSAEPRRAPPDRGIKAWRDDDPEAREREAFERKPTREQEAEAQSRWLARFQRPNDPEVARRIARQGVGRDLTEA